MNLDLQTCTQARLTRDARFDGKFFIGVRTSGVYCRSICPAPHAKESNVRYYPTAAAAAEAGFRPCLRCRPECSPGTPAWIGTPNTVSRALRLIAESGLEEGGVEKLAESLGVSSRHLRRLFVRHLGATPTAVAQTRRLQFAKKLIDETTLPMHRIAVASGFGCVRRFNAAIHQTYKRTPTQIRRLARQTGSFPENEYFFRLRFRPPYQWERMLAFLAPRATPGVEVVEGGTYRRSIAIGRKLGWFEASFDEDEHALLLRPRFADPCSLFTLVERVRTMFDLNADWTAIAPALFEDSELAPRITAAPGLRVPGCWNGFELAVRAVLGQQVTVKGATTLAGRLVREFGKPCAIAPGITHVFPTPAVLAEADLRRVGLTTARAATIHALARAARDGALDFDSVLDTEAFRARLLALPGIGDWTAEYIAMRALREPDAFPAGDLGLLRASGLRNQRELERHADRWRPWRAYAAMYLWLLPQPSKTHLSTQRRSGAPPTRSDKAAADHSSVYGVGLA